MRIVSSFVAAACALALLAMVGIAPGMAQSPPTPPAKPGAAPAAPAAPPSVNGGAPGQTFGAWIYGCPASGKCLVLQQLSETLSRRVVFVWLIQYDDNNQLVAVFRVPTGVFVNRGLVMTIDQAQQGMRVDYQQCNANECQAVFAINADLQKQFSAAKAVSVAVALNSGQTVNVQLKMDGFAGAIAALTQKKTAP